MDARTYYGLKKMMDEAGLETPAELKRMMRKEYANKEVKQGRSLREEWRTVCSKDNGEIRYDYCIVQDNGGTDDEIQWYVDNLKICVDSPYGCTGRPFTLWTHWKRVGAGIAIVHAIGLDV